MKKGILCLKDFGENFYLCYSEYTKILFNENKMNNRYLIKVKIYTSAVHATK